MAQLLQKKGHDDPSGNGALEKLAGQNEFAAAAVNSLFPIIARKIPSDQNCGNFIDIFSSTRKPTHNLWDMLLREFRGKSKDEILGKEAAKICEEMAIIHETVNPSSPEDIATQMLSCIMDNLKKHQEKPVEKVYTIDPQKYYLAIPFRRDYLSKLAPIEGLGEQDLHVTIKYELSLSDLSLIGQQKNVKIHSIYEAYHEANNSFNVEEGKYSAIVVDVDGIAGRDNTVGGFYHLTTEAPKNSASKLGMLCQHDCANVRKISGTNQIYGYVCLMKKHGGWPVSIGVDLDNTTFGPKSGVTLPKLSSGEIDFQQFYSASWTMENYQGLPLLQLLNQVQPSHLHFITNRRCDYADAMTTCFASLASTFLGRSINFEISFEPGKIRGSPKERLISKARSKESRLLKASAGSLSILFDDECVPYLSSPKVIGVDVLENCVKVVKTSARPFVVSFQGCVGTGKTTVWKIVCRMLQDNGISARYMAADQLTDIPGGCYKYVESIIPTLQCDVLIFDTTCATGKPSFVDMMLQQNIPDRDAYITLCFSRLIKRIGHPTLNSPVSDFLGVATVSTDFENMHLFELMQNLYAQHGYDGMKSWFNDRGFELRERTYGSTQTVIVAYREFSQIWTKWGRQARGFKIILGEGKQPRYVACQQLQRGTELVTNNTAQVEDDVENFQYHKHFAREQQVLLAKIRKPDDTPMRLLAVGKDDGMLCSVVLVPKSDPCYPFYVDIMKNDHTNFAQEILTMCTNLPFIIVFQSQKTMITGDVVNFCIVTSLQQVFLPSMVLDRNKHPKELIKEVLPPFLEVVKSFYSLVSSTLKGKAVLMFECCCKGATDYKGNFHHELTANGDACNGSFRLLGINFEDERAWKYIPSAILSDAVKSIFESLGLPAGFITKTVGDLNMIITSLTRCIRGEISLEDYVSNTSKFCAFGEPENISPEGFVVFEIGENYNNLGLVGTNYNKVKVAEYYICHKWEKYLFDILSLSDEVAASVSRWFGSVYFVRKLFKQIPEKLSLLLNEGDKYLSPGGEFYAATREKLRPEAVDAALATLQHSKNVKQMKPKKAKKKKKEKDLYKIFVEIIEPKKPSSIRPFLANNDGPRQFVYKNLVAFCTNAFGLVADKVEEFEEVLLGLCHKVVSEERDTIVPLLKTVERILQKQHDGDGRDHKALRIARDIQKLYPYFQIK